MPVPLSLPAVALVLAAAATAQELRLRDGPRLSFRPFVHDVDRGRIVVVGSFGDTREWDGQRWLFRTVASPQLPGHVAVYDPVSHRTLALAHGSSGDEMWSYDGSLWQQLPPAAVPWTQFMTWAMTFDPVRGRPLLLRTAPANGPASETWEWNGSQWSQLQPLSSPPARWGARLVFDQTRSRAVLFGGGLGANQLDETWEWDGTNWLLRQPAARPPGRGDHAMAYDAVRQRVVLFGGRTPAGPLADLWEYDGTTWQQQNPAGSNPSPRHSASLIDEPGSSELLLIGGLDDVDETRDAFRWNGVRWLPRPGLPAVPTMRSRVAAAQVPGTGNVLVFGGTPLPSLSTAETWLWDGSTWTPTPGGGGPAVRFSASLWWDSTDVFLFGGQQFTAPGPLADTWRWSAGSWTPVSTPLAPPARSEAPVAFDLARGRAVLFGGSDAGGHLGDTWTFDGSSWRQELPLQSPPARAHHGLANDPVRNRVVLFGGVDSFGRRDDTWEWDGTTWLQRTPAVRPPMDAHVAMDFDLQLGRIVLVQAGPGGRGASAFTWDGTNWAPLPLGVPIGVDLGEFPRLVYGWQSGRLEVLDGFTVRAISYAPAVAESYGTGCGALPPLLAARTWPRLGEAGFGIELLRAPANAPCAIAGGLQQSSIPIGPCTQLVSPLLANVFRLANAGGCAELAIPVPASMALLGMQVFFQGAALDASAPAGFTTTAGLRVVVGD